MTKQTTQKGKNTLLISFAEMGINQHRVKTLFVPFCPKYMLMFALTLCYTSQDFLLPLKEGK